ncbi:cell division protein FtsW [Parablautia intestinalis]|jgi:cell division protein FtsW|uniref:Probable peptidoglycan glycosyltransferase FtsW n=1 Tax=Parablautia intestinalis TaxID=2320100 RepID=A0A3A9AFK5_9FIRM|nr:putative peptidoglycan glycosyltransferase FtsW [Parablautia intestinalis]MCI8615111.1 cell division protein FtsW [Lachnospiraceae bacterium]RKI90159.1 cell division protein FtsW [Parablautia intestinalis]
MIVAQRRYQNNHRGRVKKQEESFFDYTLLFIVLFLLAFGLVMLYSSSSYEGSTLKNPDPAYFLKKQAASTVVGMAAMIVVANIPYHFWERFATMGYIVSIVLILLIIPFGVEANGAKRWLNIAGISVQPAEIAKVGMILFLASLICKVGRKIRSGKGFFIVLGIPVPVCLLVWKITENMSSAIIILGIAVLMLFVACPDYKRFVLIGLLGTAVCALAVFLIANSADSEGLGVRGTRILAWLDPEAYASGKGFQTLQSLYAIGSGGILGKGLGRSMQKLGFIPEAQNDMIFSIICEELGLFGAISILLMFMLLIWRFMVIANNAPDLFGALLVVGVMGHIAIQVILNVAVVTNTIPNTGISLPFISFGGTSVLFLLIEVGIVLSVGKGIRLKDL